MQPTQKTALSDKVPAAQKEGSRFFRITWLLTLVIALMTAGIWVYTLLDAAPTTYERGFEASLLGLLTGFLLVVVLAVGSIPLVIAAIISGHISLPSGAPKVLRLCVLYIILALCTIPVITFGPSVLAAWF